MQPQIGKIVWYVDIVNPETPQAFVPEAAIITRVNILATGNLAPESLLVDLAVFHISDTTYFHNIPFAEKPTPGHWSWPPVEA